MELKIDLQLFSEEKTEKATPKRRKEAREKGNVLQSREINSAFMLLGAFLLLNIMSSYLGVMMKQMTEYIYSQFLPMDFMFSIKNIQRLVIICSVYGIIVGGPIALVCAVAGLLCSYLQVGSLFTTKPLAFDLNKINPIEGFKRMFSTRSLIELLKAFIRIVAIAYISYSYIKNQIDLIFKTTMLDIKSIVQIMMKMTITLGLRAAIVLIGLAILDYGYQRYDYEKKLKMSKQEIKEEFKQTEGNPQIKSKIREKQRQISLRRMMQDVPKADVIITNPTHFAIAIQYDPQSFEAPRVLAKGKDLIAQNIKKIGVENSVPLVENKLLARALYAQVEVGGFIPPELYQGVAEVLAYVYRLNKKI